MSGVLLTSSSLHSLIPCTPSMILLDKVFLESETRAIGQKCITNNEAVFMGHFPGHPILPGVLQVEAMAQLAEVLLRKKLDPGMTGDFYLKSIRRVKFRKPNMPGDRLIIELDVTAINSDSADFSATIKNGAGVCCSANGTVAVRPKQEDTTPIAEFNAYDKGVNCEMDTVAIQALIPHRFPFLLVDYICKIEGSHVCGIKNLTHSEPVFRTYSDGYSVLESAFQPEILAQAGATHMLAREENKGKIAYFMGIDEANFYEPIYPGQQLRMEMDMPDSKSRFGKGCGFMYVNDKMVSETHMMFALVDP